MDRLIRKYLVLTFLPLASAQAESLSGSIDRILRQLPSGASVSMKAVRLSDGSVLYERNSKESLNPASTVKLVTAAAALKNLGPEFSFKTEVYAQGGIRNGSVQEIWLKGYGDPFFVTEELESRTNELWAKGLRQIEGGIYLDDTYFERDQPVTYLSDETGKVYEVRTGPLSFNFNTIEIRTRRGRRLGDQIVRRGVDDPAANTGNAFIEALGGKGITVGGGVRRQAIPLHSVQILAHSSPPLKKLLGGLGKHSNNFTAEQIFITLGARRFGPPGSALKGRRALVEYLADLGIPEGSYYVENGSGLSKTSRLSADLLVRVLLDLYRSSYREELLSSLSVAGVDGTLKKRFNGMLKGRVFAKTGSLAGVRGLAGYLKRRDDPVAFAFIFNGDHLRANRVREVERKILVALLGGGG